MDFDKFTRKQNWIYKKNFDPLAVQIEGTAPDKIITTKDHGYIVAFRHLPELVEIIEAGAAAIAKTVPCIAYTRATLHTTLGVVKKEYDEMLMQDVCEAVHYAIRRNNRCPQIAYASWLYNRTTVIAEGHADPNFVYLLNRLQGEGKTSQVDFAPPQMAHITTNRFTQAVPPEALKDFFSTISRLNEKGMIGISLPPQIDIGYYRFNENGFAIDVYESHCAE